MANNPHLYNDDDASTQHRRRITPRDTFHQTNSTSAARPQLIQPENIQREHLPPAPSSSIDHDDPRHMQPVQARMATWPSNPLQYPTPPDVFSSNSPFQMAIPTSNGTPVYHSDEFFHSPEYVAHPHPDFFVPQPISDQAARQNIDLRDYPNSTIDPNQTISVPPTSGYSESRGTHHHGDSYHQREIPRPSPPVNHGSHTARSSSERVFDAGTQLSSSAQASSSQQIHRESTRRPETQRTAAQTQLQSPDLMCPVCGSLFTGLWAAGNVARHVREKHSDDEAAVYYCDANDSCDGKFSRKDALLKHKREKHPELNIGQAIPRKP